MSKSGLNPPLLALLAYLRTPSGLNSPLLALLVDLRYSISIFVCRLVVTENISRRGNCPFCLPPLVEAKLKDLIDRFTAARKKALIRGDEKINEVRDEHFRITRYSRIL